MKGVLTLNHNGRNLASATGNWGKMRFADVPPILGRLPSDWELGGERLCSWLHKLKWSFCLTELGGWKEGAVLV